MRRSFRLRTYFLWCGLAAAAIAAAVVYSVGPTAVEAALDGALPPERVVAIGDALRDAILAAAIASLLLIVPVSLWIGGFAADALAELRAAIVRRGSVPASSAVVEVNALAAVIARSFDEHRRALAPLAQERDELAFLMDSVGEGILQVGPTGRFVRANRTARTMLGLPAHVADQPVSTLIRNAELRSILDAARRGETPEPAELAFDDRRILVVGRPLGAGGQERLGAIAVLVDLTHLRRLETVRRDFVANASHELKSPLTSIRGYAETLLGDDDMPADVRRQFLETIHRNADRLQRIVEDLLDLSRLESGGWRPDLQPLDLAAIAEDVWAILRGKAGEKNITFAIEADAGAAALADPLGVRQILTNLLDNAIRHTPPAGRIRVRIARSAGPEGTRTRSAAAARGGGPAGPLNPLIANRRGGTGGIGRWVVTEVTDTGTGIPGDALQRVFERFYRVDPARSRAEGGTGLGLAIVKHLVLSMGGDIAVESELGKGSTFRFWLPAEAPGAEKDGAEVASMEGARAPG